jgi:hypothetical protein
MSAMSASSPVSFSFPRAALLALACAFALGACDRAAPPPAQDAAPTPAADANPPAPTPPRPPTPPADPMLATLTGSSIPPYPDGYEQRQGRCVPGGEGMDRLCDFSVAMLAPLADGKGPAYVVATRNLDPGAQTARWDVQDALAVPDVGDADLQLLGCRLDGVEDPATIAIVRHGNNQEFSTDIRWTRRFDTAAGKFVEVDKARVSCPDPGYGV